MAVTFKDDPKWRTDQPSDDNPTPYKSLLYELAKEMREDDLEIIKFMFKEDVGEGILEKVASPFELFEVLEDHGKIEPPNNLSKLEEGMKTAGREDLVTKIKEFSTKSDDAARQARRRKDTPWVSKSPFAAPNQPQVVEEEEEEGDDEEKVQDSIQETDSSNGRSASDVVHPNRRLSTIPEDGHKRVALPPGNTDVIEEETQQTPTHSGEAAKTANNSDREKTSGDKGKGQEGEDNSSSKKTSSKDIPLTTSGKKKSSRFCVLL